MYALFLKEIRSFLNSLIGYITMAVFLIATGIFMWVFSGPSNVLDMGYSNLNSLFFNAPNIFLFLIPAITMRSFAEEKRSGTIEILMTKPLSDFQIILSKYLAGVVLVLLSLLPTLIFYYSVIQLGEPAGNIDHAGTWGGYIGLFLLGAVFVAIGIFASSITNNQVIAFMIALLFCFAVYIGFQFLAGLLTAPFDLIFINLGIHDHYTSLQRGVIDSRDVVYYLSVISIFLFLTKLALQTRKW